MQCAYIHTICTAGKQLSTGRSTPDVTFATSRRSKYSSLSITSQRYELSTNHTSIYPNFSEKNPTFIQELSNNYPIWRKKYPILEKTVSNTFSTVMNKLSTTLYNPSRETIPTIPTRFFTLLTFLISEERPI